MTDNAPTVYSIFDANRKMEAWMPDDPETRDLPEKILNAIIDSEEDVKICGSADDYHNLLSEYARKGLQQMAMQIAILGSNDYPENVDLLADAIRFGSESQDWESCADVYERLNTVPKELWNWRAFTFSIDYLKERLSNESGADKERTYCEAAALAKEYKESKLLDERAWTAEAELYLIKNRIEDAVHTLEEGVEKIAVAPQCCLKLADIYLERGEYTKVIQYAAIGARATAQDQPTASTAYLYFASGLAKDALIHKAALENPNEDGKGFRDSNSVKDALMDYDIAETLFRNRGRLAYINTIWMRRTILQKKSGLAKTERNEQDPKTEQLKRMLSENILKDLLEHNRPDDE